MSKDMSWLLCIASTFSACTLILI